MPHFTYVRILANKLRTGIHQTDKYYENSINNCEKGYTLWMDIV